MRSDFSELRTELAREPSARAHRTSLQEMSTRSSEATSRHEVAAVTTERVTELLGAGWSTIAYLDDDDEIVTFVHGPRTPAAIVDDWQELPLQTDLPMTAVLRGDESRIEIADTSALAGSWPLVSQRAETDRIGSLIAVAVGHEQEQPSAVVVVTWPTARAMTPDDWDLVDDVVALVAARFDAPSEPTDPAAAMPSRVSIDVEATTSELATIRRGVVDFARRTGAPPDTIDRLELAVSELATNVICHAATDHVSVALEHRSDGWELVVDGAEHLTGAGDVRLPPPDATAGRGLFVVHSVMDSVELTTIDGRRVVRCTVTG